MLRSTLYDADSSTAGLEQQVSRSGSIGAGDRTDAQELRDLTAFKFPDSSGLAFAIDDRRWLGG